MNYNYFFDICALAIAVIISIEYSFKRTISSRKTKVFLIILFATTISTVTDILSVVGLNYAEELPLELNYALTMLYYFFLHGLAPLYLVYVIVSIRMPDVPITRKESIILAIPYAIDMLLNFSSPWTKVTYYIDSDFQYHNNWGTYFGYAVAMMYIVLGIVFSVKNFGKILKSERVVVITYAVILVTCVLLQLFTTELLLINFGAMLSILFMAFTMENPLYYENQVLGTYNRVGLQTIISNNILRKSPFTVLGIEISGIMELRELVGIEAVTKTLREIAVFLQNMADKEIVFSISDSQFAIVVTGGEAELEMYIKKITHRFEDAFKLNDEQVVLSVALSRYNYPDDVNTTAGAMELLEYSLKKAGEAGAGSLIKVDKKFIEERQRASSILSILRQAINENRFSVYYQPIYSVETQKFSALEALVRLYHDEFGYISPEEFIPIAEKNGLILKIGEYVFRESCRFMAENRLWEKGIEYIDINLSPMQCIQNDLHLKLSEIIDEYKLDYFRIALEITETSGIFSSQALRENMQTLINKGVRFSLDDYGTGYANISTVVEYPFTIVKLDKSMLWSAMKNDKAMTVLRQTIRMMKQLSLQLIAEGVETEEQAQLLAYYGCDYFQGYYYAKPQNGESLIKFLDDYVAGTK